MSKILSLLILLVFVLEKYELTPVVTTAYGQIKGVDDPNADLYLGIPFATPPVNSLRWKETVDVDPWYPNMLDATNFKPACPQVNCSVNMPKESCPDVFSEDCLYLNVFVPKNATQPKAVMLFIHGGNFQYQGANSILIDGRYMANISDCVIVTIQYRLGALGFLFTGYEPNQIRGNLGLLDQRMAIKWVKRNIASFSGDPNKITLFGQSAGAQSTTLHLLSADMQEYFNNAILQSTPFSIPFRSFDEAMTINFYFTQIINCTFRDVECLMSKSVDEILYAQAKAKTKISSIRLLEFFEPWLPWIDGDLVKGQLLEFEKWNLPSNFTFKPFTIGTLTEECVIYIYSGFNKPVDTAEYAELILAAFKKHAPQLIQKFPPKLSSKDQRDILAVVATQWVFSCSTRHFLERAIQYKKSSPNKYFQYVFDFPLDFDGWDNFTYCVNHTCHGSDLPYTFDSADYLYTNAGKLLTRSHIRYWSNFAKYSQPLSDTFNMTWPEYDVNSKPYLRFKQLNEINNNYLKDSCDFFDSIGYYS